MARWEMLKMATPTIISAHSVVYGDIISSACVDVEGKVIGNIRCDYLIVRKGGVVEGDVTANAVILDGNVAGNVKAKQAHIKKHGKVDGSVIYAKIIAEDGARITGKLSAEALQQDVTKNIPQDSACVMQQDNAND